MTQPVILIGGGNSYTKHEDFLEYLKTTPLRSPTGERTVRWTDTLRHDLGEDFTLYAPLMPNKENARYEEWKIWFERHCELINSDAIVIGYSLGGMFISKYLMESAPPVPIKALFLLGAPCGHYSDGAGNDCGSFQFDTTNLHTIAQHAQHIFIMHSEDDFVVPYSHAEEYAANIPSAELVSFTDKNHFLDSTFPEIVERIKSF